MWADTSTTRAELGTTGAWLGAMSRVTWAEERDAAQRMEAAGYSTLWINEAPPTKEPFAHAANLLAATESIHVATGVANIWVRDAVAARNGAMTVAEVHPGRFTLGLGVSHQPLVNSRGHTYTKPLAEMRAYLDGLDAIPYTDAIAPATPPGLLLAALRPKMLELSAQRTAGAHPYFVPVEHTAIARSTLGPDAVLAPEVAFVLDDDVDAAREKGRAWVRMYLTLPNYTNNLRDLGYTDEDLTAPGSDRLVDAVVACGDADAIVAYMQAHRDAGADHIALQPVGVGFAEAVTALETLAPLLA